MRILQKFEEPNFQVCPPRDGFPGPTSFLLSPQENILTINIQHNISELKEATKLTITISFDLNTIDFIFWLRQELKEWQSLSVCQFDHNLF